MKPVYLDNNATTRLDPMVLDAMMPFLTDFYGNPSSIHDFGLPAQAALERAHQQVAALLGADYPSEIIFTSCATEATTTAIASAVALMPERREIITSVVEHPATLAVCEQLERQGYLIHRIAVDRQGALDMAQFRAALSPRVALVSIMWANNETGVMFPVPELAELAHEQGALFHCDAVQQWAKSRWRSARRGSICSPARRINSTAPKGWAASGCGGERGFARCCAAATRRMAGGPVRKISAALSGWVPPASWRRSISRAWRRLASCAIALHTISRPLSRR